MAFGSRVSQSWVVGTLMAVLAVMAFAPTAHATSGGHPQNYYSFVDSEDPLGPTTGLWDDVGGGAALALGDDASIASGLFGFSFIYWGQVFTSCRVCSNGFLNFGIDSTAFDNQPIPTVGLPEFTIMPFWDDLIILAAANGGGVFTSTLGAAPNRRFVIEWRNTVFFADNVGQFNSIDFEVVLFETTNDIEFRYRTCRGPLGRGDSATIGLEDETGTNGYQYEHLGNPVANHVKNGLVIHWTSFSTLIPALLNGAAAVPAMGVQSDARSRNSGGHLCFVTNASFGTSIAEEVRVLCRFRDVFLMGTLPGREFVDFYYRSSPPLANLIGSEEGVRLPLQMALRPPIWFASFMLFSTAAEKAAVAALVLVLGMVLGRAMCRRLAEPEA